MAEQIRIEAPALAHLIARLEDADALLAPVLRNLLNRAALGAQAEAMARTPVVTGHLRRSMAIQIDEAGSPTWAKVGSDLVYAPFIEFGERHDRRHGVVRRKAGPVRMLRDGATAAIPTFRRAVATAARELEAAWRAWVT